AERWMEPGSAGGGRRQTADERDEFCAESPEPADDLVRRERRPRRPVRIVLGAIAPQHRAFLDEEAAQPIEEHRVVARQVSEVLPRRPLVGPGPRVERAWRGAGEDEVERLQLGLETPDERGRDGHQSLHGAVVTTPAAPR